MFQKKNTLLFFLQISLYIFPISLIVVSLLVNINIIIFILLGLSYLLLNKLKIFFNHINLSLLLFFITLIFSSFLNIEEIGLNNFIKSIFLLKFFLLFILIESLIYHQKIKLNYFFNICLILIIFLSIDLSIQFFFGKNIFGYEPWEGRITGIFEHEAVAGSFLQKIFLFSLIGCLMLFFNKGKKEKNFLSLILIIVIFGSFVASNRISFLMVLTTVIFLTVFYKIFRKNITAALVLLLPAFLFLYQSNDQINNRYKSFVGKIIQFSNVSSDIKLNNVEVEVLNLKDSEKQKNKKIVNNHAKIYLTTYESFKENIFIGHGLKSFRYRCNKFLKLNNTLCSTHSHNYHLEVLHDVGLLGFLFISFFSFSLIIKTVSRLRTENLSYKEKIILSLLLLNFLIELFPLKSTGSLFTTWNGTLLWLSISLVNYKNSKNNFYDK